MYAVVVVAPRFMGQYCHPLRLSATKLGFIYKFSSLFSKARFAQEGIFFALNLFVG